MFSQKNTTFRKLDLLPFSGKMVTPILVSLRKS